MNDISFPLISAYLLLSLLQPAHCCVHAGKRFEPSATKTSSFGELVLIKVGWCDCFLSCCLLEASSKTLYEGILLIHSSKRDCFDSLEDEAGTTTLL